MAYEPPKQAMVSSSTNPTLLQTNNQNISLDRRDHHFIKSTPSAANDVPQKSNGIISSSLQHFESIFGKFCPMLRPQVVYFALYLGLGTMFFYFFRHQMKGKKTNGVIDAVYFCIVTMTTVGYGDVVPNTVLTKLFSCAFVFIGMALVGQVLSNAADHLIEKQEKLLHRAFNEDQNESRNKEVETNKVRNKCFVALSSLLAIIIFGIIILVFVEEMNFVDAFYCVCCTIATLGYGDKSFSTKGGRVFAAVWILLGTICLALFFLYVAELKTESRRQKIVHRVLHQRLTKRDLEAADLDGDKRVKEAEFIISKLKEIKKIKEEDISPLRERFKQLDVHRKGFLTESDLNTEVTGGTI